jgi:hypothetical protein
MKQTGSRDRETWGQAISGAQPWICGLFEVQSDWLLGGWSEVAPEGVKMNSSGRRSQVES